MDRHNRYGTFLNQRISTLVRFGHGVTGRVSAGTGVFVPTPFTAENLEHFKQSGHDPLLRPRRNFEGQFTVDQWAPLDGRVINGGIRFRFNYR